MNWKAIKHIYRNVLIYGDKFEYLGGDKYRLTDFYPTGEKWWEQEYQNGKLHGRNIGWGKNEQKLWEGEYQNGKLIK